MKCCAAHSMLSPGSQSSAYINPSRRLSLMRMLPPGVKQTLRRRLLSEAHRAFDLENGPLLRAILFGRNGISEHILLLSMDHIVTDFWSMTILARELLAVTRRTSLTRPLNCRHSMLIMGITSVGSKRCSLARRVNNLGVLAEQTGWSPRIGLAH